MTLHTVEIQENKAEQVSNLLSKSFDTTHQSWYVDFKNNQFHYIIFPYKVFKADRTKKEEYQKAVDYGLTLGIPKHQLDFAPEVKEWKR